MTAISNRFQLVPAVAQSPTIAALIPMLQNCRTSVLEAVKDLSAEELSRQFDAKANPIGSLLAHIAAVEWVYLVMSVDAREPTALEWAQWGNFMRLTPVTWEATKGQPLQQHIDRLNNVREQTLAGLAKKSEGWLQEPLNLIWLPEPANNLWAWYHVLEDELNHRGQIRWLRQRL